ncbi:unnamed protein product [Lupinus luteus]|uniref:BHLH domain-containing protein n=1 Tax=Lupinus luteus TaxID=3873 RepID=A0AAV1YMG4_LUPLU
MEPDLGQHPPMFLDQQQQISSGLTRYRSAPSSYFSNIIDKEFYESTFNRPSSPETERVFARFMSNLSGSSGSDGGAEDSISQNIQPGQPVSAVKEEIINQQSHDVPSMNNEQVIFQQQQRNNSNYGSSTPQKVYQSSGRPPLPNHMKTGLGSTSNLIRHGSSPAGLFSTINIEGYAAIRGMGTLGTASSTSENANFSPASRLKNAPNYSSGIVSSKAEIGNESSEQNRQVREGFAESRGNDFIPAFPISPWDESSIMPDNIGGVKRRRDDDDDDVKPFSGSKAAETQNETGGQPSVPLAHQLSMPNTPMEMAAIEKFLQSSDSVPWKIRAKRGCATHPRSIAERVRRTKISERMKKLQDLVPTMDNQTKTADMLDLAVEYIKDLQKQVLTLSESQAKCTCSHKQQQ